MTRAFLILKSQPFEERSRIITALSRDHGKITAVARNSVQSRRFGATLELFSVSDWDIKLKEHSDSNLHRVDGAQIITSFDQIAKDYDLYKVACQFNEIMIKVAPENVPSEDLFKLHFHALSLLNDFAQNKSSPESILIKRLGVEAAYYLKVLQWAGVQPSLMSCRTCGSPTQEISPEKTISPKTADAGFSCCVLGEGPMLTLSSLYFGLLAMSQPIKKCIEALDVTEQDLKVAAEDLIPLAQFARNLMFYHVPGADPGKMTSYKN